MTSFSARRLNTAPWLEVYAVDGASAPRRVGMDPSPFVKPGAIKFSNDGETLAMVSPIRPADAPLDDLNEMLQLGRRIWSKDERYLLLGGDAANKPRLYGPVYGAMRHMPTSNVTDVDPGVFVIDAAFDGLGRYLAVVYSDAPTVVRVFKFSSGGWNQVASLTAPFEVSTPEDQGLNTVFFDGDRVSVGGSTVPYVAMWKRDGDNFDAEDRPTAISGYRRLLLAVGSYVYVEAPLTKSLANPTQTVSGRTVEAWAYDSILDEMVVVPYSGAGAFVIASVFRPTTADGSRLYAGRIDLYKAPGRNYVVGRVRSNTSNRPNQSVFGMLRGTISAEGLLSINTFVNFADGSLPIPTTATSVAYKQDYISAPAFSPTGGFLLNYSYRYSYVVSSSTRQGSFNRTSWFGPNDTSAEQAGGISGSSGALQAVAEFLNESFGATPTTPAPIAAITSGGTFTPRRVNDWSTPIDGFPYPFATDLGANDVRDISYSPNGTYILFRRLGVVLPGFYLWRKGESWEDATLLSGTFVSVSKWNEIDEVFQEIGYIELPEDTEVSDLVISAQAEALSFHAVNADDPNVDGRYFVNIDPDVELIDKSYDGVARSRMAFSPSNPLVYFAGVPDGEGAGQSLSLFKFPSGRPSYAETDAEDSYFGPMDFSNCDDIVVAHGLAGQPFTFYKRTGDTIEEAILEGMPEFVDVIDVKFLPDCGGLVVLTPDEIVLIETEEEEVEDPDNPGETKTEVTVTNTTSLPISSSANDGSGGDGQSESGDPASLTVSSSNDSTSITVQRKDQDVASPNTRPSAPGMPQVPPQPYEKVTEYFDIVGEPGQRDLEERTYPYFVAVNVGYES